MKIMEANKIVAGYMGGYFSEEDGITTHYKDGEQYASRLYSASLDALIPVWEKLGETSISISTIPHSIHPAVKMLSVDINNSKVVGKMSVQEAACIATAKAIKAMEVENV